MAISITRYVDITSSVGAGVSVNRRSLKGRIFDSNPLIPVGSFVTFTNATDVLNYFGVGEEYNRALFYFGWISKNGLSPQSLDFARWANGAQPPMIFGNKQIQTLGTYTAITSGTFGLTIGGVSHTFNINFSTATDLDAPLPAVTVASLLTDAINAAGSFVLVGDTNGNTTVDMASTAGLAVGMSVLAADIAQGTTIVSIIPNTSITLSAAATGSNIGENITFNTPVWGLATVSYDPVRGAFVFTGGATGANTISVQAGVGGTPIAGPGAQNILGWYYGSTLVISDGSAGETALQAVQNSAMASNNFGSFLFIDTLGLDTVTLIAQWNNAENVLYMYLVAVTNQTDAESYEAALIGYGGTGVELSPIAGQYVDQMPMNILAATDYDSPNSVQNYMFQIFPGVDASVSDDTTANLYDSLRINYYGVTQTAGQYLAFFQRGNLMGGDSAPIAMNVYANEMWLKDAMAASLMTLLVAQSRVPANTAGQSQILAILQSVINEALSNGTISANKILTPSQINFINTTSGDPNAWYQVQNSGYWVTCSIVPYTNPNTGLTEYKAVYTLIYSKDDTVNLITGQQILI